MAKKQSGQQDAEAALAEQLRSMFDSIVEQPVPDKIIDLVDVLEEKRRHSDGAADDR